jgi:hypothetical protein
MMDAARLAAQAAEWLTQSTISCSATWQHTTFARQSRIVIVIILITARRN